MSKAIRTDFDPVEELRSLATADASARVVSARLIERTLLGELPAFSIEALRPLIDKLAADDDYCVRYAVSSFIDLLPDCDFERLHATFSRDNNAFVVSMAEANRKRRAKTRHEQERVRKAFLEIGALSEQLRPQYATELSQLLSTSTMPAAEQGDGAKRGALLPDGEWITVTDAAKLLMDVVSGLGLKGAQARVSRSASRDRFRTNDRKGAARRIELHSFNSWRFSERERDLRDLDD